MRSFIRDACFETSIAIVFTAVVMLSPVHAASLGGVDMPDKTTVDGKPLVLNGLGVRTATMLKVKVYVIGLYLESRSSDAKAIIGSDQTKRIAMHFVHDVTAKELREGWSEGFEGNYKDVASIKEEISQFNASMRDVKSGDTIVLNFSGDTVTVTINDSKIDSVRGNAFQEAALSIWLGPKPPNKELKVGIVGG
jgi:hypothetical protein